MDKWILLMLCRKSEADPGNDNIEIAEEVTTNCARGFA